MPAASFEELVNSLKPPRIIWLMIPAGTPVDENDSRAVAAARTPTTLSSTAAIQITRIRSAGQRIWKRTVSIRRCGYQRGYLGPAEGYSIMVGGDEAVVERLRPIFETLAPAADRAGGASGPRRWPFHEDGSQRHRVRHDAGLWGRLRDPRTKLNSIWICTGCRNLARR